MQWWFWASLFISLSSRLKNFPNARNRRLSFLLGSETSNTSYLCFINTKHKYPVPGEGRSAVRTLYVLFHFLKTGRREHACARRVAPGVILGCGMNSTRVGASSTELSKAKSFEAQKRNGKSKLLGRVSRQPQPKSSQNLWIILFEKEHSILKVVVTTILLQTDLYRIRNTIRIASVF